MNLSTCFYNTLNTLGINEIRSPLCRSTKTGVRFDIGDSSDLDVYSSKLIVNPKYVEYCLNRVNQIIDSLHSLPNILAIQLYYIDEKDLEEKIKEVLLVTELPYPHEIEKTKVVLDDEKNKIAVLLWDLTIISFSKQSLLKEIVISDLGGEHLLTASVFWIWSNHKIIFHLYDDRGADLVTSDRSVIKEIHLKFNNWILE